MTQANEVSAGFDLQHPKQGSALANPLTPTSITPFRESGWAFLFFNEPSLARANDKTEKDQGE